MRSAKGGLCRHGNGGRHRHAERGAGKSGGGWRVASAVDAQVGGASQRERRLGAGETSRI